MSIGKPKRQRRKNNNNIRDGELVHSRVESRSPHQLESGPFVVQDSTPTLLVAVVCLACLLLLVHLHVLQWRDKDVAQADDLLTWKELRPKRYCPIDVSLYPPLLLQNESCRHITKSSMLHRVWNREDSVTYVLVLEVLQQLQFSVGALRQNRGAEGLHDLLDGDRLTGQFILGWAIFLFCFC
jgi:hypothetical protein